MAPRSEEQNAAIKDERREQILSAALKVFSRRGYAATRIGDIVKACGISHGLLYHYFESKENIFCELFKTAMDSSLEFVLTVDDMPLRPIEKVRQTASIILDNIARDEETAYYFFIVVHGLMTEGLDEVRRTYVNTTTMNDAMARIIREGQEAGEMRDGDRAEMATVFFSAIMGLALQRLMSEDFELPDAEILVNLVKKQA